MSTPEYGPRGYLPPKAAKRARKIILREQMGFGWPLAALVASVVVVVAGVAFLRSANQPPTAPFVALGPVEQIAAGSAGVLNAGADAAVVVRVGGAVRSFAAQHPQTVWCPQSQRLESPTSTWRADGRHASGPGSSLRPLDTMVFGGVVYADFTTTRPAPDPAPDGGAPRCAGAS